MRVRRGSWVGFVLLWAVASPALLRAAELSSEQLKAWNEYIAGADGRVSTQLQAGGPFLWSDQAADRGARLRQGEIVALPLADHGTKDIPNGLIHDWFGAIFIPNATIASVLAVVHDYDHYKDYYAPTVVASKNLNCESPDQEFSMLWRRKILFVNAALKAQYRARDFEVNERRWYSIAGTTRVQEIENYGHSGERLLPPDQGSGFLWRLHSIVRYEERDGGVYVELEAIGLTRDIPSSLRWLVSPIVDRLSKNSVITSLRQTRDAVRARATLVAQRR